MCNLVSHIEGKTQTRLKNKMLRKIFGLERQEIT
jgi:hypothetical protein